MNERRMAVLCSNLSKEIAFLSLSAMPIASIMVQLQRTDHFLSEVKEKGEGHLCSLCDLTPSCCRLYL